MRLPVAEAPSRKGLVLGLALVALHGRRQESILAARHRGLADWSACPAYAECTRVLRALKEGQSPVTTNDNGLLDLMAHTRQLARVSLDEWVAAVPLQLAPPCS